MTHAESHELLLDLAFGELDAARASEVEQHVQGCDECARAWAALDQARRATAPLRELEEPSPGFEDRIMAAAKAQAQVTHEGNIGRVIEVAGSVKPLGLTAATIDPHRPVAVQPADRRRPRWMLRVALGGSVAAAAALALVVSSTLQNRQAAEMAAKTGAYEIRIQPVDAAKKDEAPKALASEQPPPQPASPSAAAPAATVERKEAAPRKAKKMPERDDLARGAGSGGDTGNAVVPLDFDASDLPSGSAGKLALEKRAEAAPPPPAMKAEPKPEPQAQAAPPAQKPGGGTGTRNLAVLEQAPARQVASAPAAVASLPAEAHAQALRDAEAPESMEKRAEDARHAGNYALAAGLYRRAAALHKDAATPNASSAAWDLAHAVECLAAAGQFAEAGRVRDELVKLYPSEDSAFYAASRALRSVQTTQPAQAEPAR